MWRNTSRPQIAHRRLARGRHQHHVHELQRGLDQHHGEEQEASQARATMPRAAPAGGEAPAGGGRRGARRGSRDRDRSSRSRPAPARAANMREHHEQGRGHLRAVGRARRARAGRSSLRVVRPCRGPPPRGSPRARCATRRRGVRRSRGSLRALEHLRLGSPARAPPRAPAPGRAARRGRRAATSSAWRPALDDAALVEHDDLVGVAHARDPRCATTTTVRPRNTSREARAGSPPRSPRRRSRACRRGSGCSGRSASARASAVRWRCPPESITPRSPTIVS